MARRTYGQYCGLAGALDMVGERWTLLVVRELMSGPKRYTDLAEALPGIGTSLLATRLKGLEDSSIVQRFQLPAPAASTVYRLTEIGEELGAALVPMMIWGLRHAVPEERAPDMVVNPNWALVGLTHQVVPSALEGIDATYRFVVEGLPAYVRIREGRAAVVQADPDLAVDATVTLDMSTVAAIGAGRTNAVDAVLAGRITLDGDQKALDDLVRAFSEPAA